MGKRLFVGNLSFSITSDALRAAFEQHGTVEDLHIATDRETGQPRGFAFVTMGTAESAAAAMEKMNGAVLEGRALRVNEAEERPPRRGPGGGGGFGGGGGGFGGGGGGRGGRDRGGDRGGRGGGGNRW